MSRNTTTYRGTGIISEDQPLTNELRRPITIQLKKRKVYPPYSDNIWDANLADMQLISKCNKRVKSLLCAINIYSKCTGIFR